MKVKYTTTNGQITFEADLEKVKTAFEFVAHLVELFEEKCCGCCQSEHIQPRVRHHDSYVFYELRCLDCNAQLAFGQKKEGGHLFPKRYDSELRQPLPDRGWHIYDPGNTGDGQPTQSQSRPSPQTQNQNQNQRSRSEDIPF